MMTALAFIVGACRYDSVRAGAIARQIIVRRFDGGMLAETFIGRFFVPAIFYVVEKFSALRNESIATHARRGAQFGDDYEEDCTLRNSIRAGSGRRRCMMGPNYKRPTVSVLQVIAALYPTTCRAGRWAREVVDVYQTQCWRPDSHRAPAKL